MYCGSNPTARLSQRQLAQAMFRLLEAKPFSAITVSELCRAAAVSRQTFYSLFDSKESVITYTLTEYYCYTPEPEAGTLHGTRAKARREKRTGLCSICSETSC